MVNEIIFVKGRGLAKPSVRVNLVETSEQSLHQFSLPEKGDVQTRSPRGLLSDHQKGKYDKTKVIVLPRLLMALSSPGGSASSPYTKKGWNYAGGSNRSYFQVKTQTSHLSCKEVCW